MIYLLIAIGLSPGGSSTVHIYTQTIHRTIRNKQYIEQHNNFGRVRPVPLLGQLFPDICLTTEEKARKNLVGQRKEPGTAINAMDRKKKLASHFQHACHTFPALTCRTQQDYRKLCKEINSNLTKFKQFRFCNFLW